VGSHLKIGLSKLLHLEPWRAVMQSRSRLRLVWEVDTICREMIKVSRQKSPGVTHNDDRWAAQTLGDSSRRPKEPRMDALAPCRSRERERPCSRGSINIRRRRRGGGEGSMNSNQEIRSGIIGRPSYDSCISPGRRVGPTSDHVQMEGLNVKAG